ncbi:copper chaperone PCu(A)C [Halocynthiibacter styelae]|uniref:Copper chaperone PCu(A)C n=1 Tax=Halocynthiibacter styelae TaxID=2761955 RepID=A0A8J7LLI7_9RHOB|nr:copper chaperone PCu(A)C [Paenihalocynthiibacter styelae]MBI1495440.1 copper chaperone PCu(A)C [Paenihalocynthiibacter styelae]
MKTCYFRPLALCAVLLLTATPGFAGAEDVRVTDPWARASIGVNRPGAAYLTLHNTGQDDVTLTGVTTPLALRPEIHLTSTNAEGISSMRRAGDITIAAGESVSLEPGGLHTMLMQLQTPMQEGESFPLTFEFSDGGTVTADVPVLGLAARGPLE